MWDIRRRTVARIPGPPRRPAPGAWLDTGFTPVHYSVSSTLRRSSALPAVLASDQEGAALPEFQYYIRKYRHQRKMRRSLRSTEPATSYPSTLYTRPFPRHAFSKMRHRAAILTPEF